MDDLQIPTHRMAPERLLALFETIDDHLVQYDREWRYVFVTAKGAAMIGKTPQELLGRSIWELFPEAIGNEYYRRLHEAAATGQTIRFEHYYAPFDRWFENHVYPSADGVAVFAADITQRKRAEAELRKVEQRQAAIVELVPAGVYWCDEQGLLRYFNRRAAELWGQVPKLGDPEQRFCGSLRLYTPAGEPLPREECPMADVVRTGVPVRNKEAVMERPDGSRLTAMVNIDPILDDDGKVRGAINVFQDITERKRTELELGRLAAIVESSTDAIVGKTLDGIVTSWNAAAERLYGYPAAEMIGQPVTRLYPADRVAEEERILERIRAGERVPHFETCRLRSDGRPVEVSVTVSPVRDMHGRIVGASSASHDIAARKAGERALRTSEQRYRSLVEASGALVFVSDGAANWQQPNPAWAAYTGQSFAEYRGHGWAAAIHPEDRDRMQASVARAIATQTTWHDTARIWHAPSSEYRHQEARAVPIRGADGTIVEWIGTVIDTHARTVAEDAVREADRRKDEFLAVLAHELRNPLAPIVSSLQLLRQPDAAAPPTQLLDILERQVHHLVRLVDDLMEVARITRGTIELRQEALPVQDAVRGAIEICRPLIDAHGQRLDLIAPAKAVAVLGDRVRLTQIVANLLNNATKYTPRGGRIIVKVERDGRQALVRIADDGIGIAPELQERIFEMFRRGGGSHESYSSGLGIGLSLARHLAQLHGGSLEVFSEGPGRGSEFTLRLPVATEAVGQPSPTPPATVKRRRVMVVDDNRDAAVSLGMLLRAMGLEVQTAHDGASALDLAGEFRPHAVLLDLGMPAPDGFEVARRMRRATWGKRVKIVAVSGWGQDRDRMRSAEAGFDLHLLKPVGADDLRRALED